MIQIFKDPKQIPVYWKYSELIANFLQIKQPFLQPISHVQVGYIALTTQ